MATPNNKITRPEQPKKTTTRPAQQHASGIIIPNWWRWQIVAPFAVLTVISIGFSISLLSDTKQRIAEQQTVPTNNQAWYLQQSAPETLVDLTGNQALFPDPREVPEDHAGRAYEEPLPQDLYEHAPVATGISSIAQLTEVSKSGVTRVVIPEEDVPPQDRGYDPQETTTQGQQAKPEPENQKETQLAALTQETTIPAVREETATWQKHALAFDIPPTTPMIAIIIDDMGVDKRRSRRATTLRGPLTLSYLTYATEIGSQTRLARAAGHELMLHVPMQPGNDKIDPGPNVLNTTASADEILRKLRWGLGRFDGYVGINNHMGSRFTQYKDGMRIVLSEIAARGLLFLDSRTSGGSVAAEIARETSVTFASRNVFLDHVNDRETVRQQLAQTERLARQNGSAIAIGHPRDATLDVLEEWLSTLPGKGIVQVPLSAIIMRTQQNSLLADSN